jgi:light-regulated signal transduction histidine kinase (bacteriophytochrome)
MTFAQRLFQPFQRFHTADQFEGTGIGLASFRRIVERHGGEVWARGVPGEGARFGFVLPDKMEEMT